MILPKKCKSSIYSHPLCGVTLSRDNREANVDPKWLRNIPLFSSLKLNVLESISELLVVERYDANKIIFEEGSLGDKLYIIVAGMVEISRKTSTPNQREVLAKLIDGDFFGEIALLRDMPRNARATTQGVCIFLTIAHQNFLKVFKHLTPEAQSLLNKIVDERSV